MELSTIVGAGCVSCMKRVLRTHISPSGVSPKPVDVRRVCVSFCSRPYRRRRRMKHRASVPRIGRGSLSLSLERGRRSSNAGFARREGRPVHARLHGLQRRYTLVSPVLVRKLRGLPPVRKDGAPIGLRSVVRGKTWAGHATPASHTPGVRTTCPTATGNRTNTG